MASLLVPVITKIGGSVVHQLSKVAVDQLNDALNKIDPDTKEAREAAAWYYLTYDQKAELRNIENRLEEAIIDIKTSLGTETAKLQAILTYKPIDDRLHLLWEALRKMRAADEATLAGRRDQFCQIYREVNPEQLLSILCKDITEIGVNRQMLTAMMDSCDYPVFEKWCECVKLDVMKMCICIITYCNIAAEIDKAFQDQAQIIKEDVESAGRMSVRIFNTLEQAKITSSSKFFQGDESELVRAIDEFFINVCEKQDIGNQYNANELGKQLAQKYYWMDWAVVIFENPTGKTRNVAVKCTGLADHVFLAESVHSKMLTSWMTPNAVDKPTHRVISSGCHYGLLLCRRQYQYSLSGRQHFVAVFFKRRDYTILHKPDLGENWMWMSIEEVFPPVDDLQITGGLLRAGAYTDSEYYKSEKMSTKNLCEVRHSKLELRINHGDDMQEDQLGVYPVKKLEWLQHLTGTAVTTCKFHDRKIQEWSAWRIPGITPGLDPASVDFQILLKTVYAQFESSDLQKALAWMIKNRADRWGKSIAEVCHDEEQFHCWANTSDIEVPDAERQRIGDWLGNIFDETDPTDGALYCNVSDKMHWPLVYVEGIPFHREP